MWNLMMRTFVSHSTFIAALSLALASPLFAQSSSPAAATTAAAVAPTLPSDYVIGAEDVLGILFWREQEMSGDATVRPDGMITLPLVGDVRAAGYRPDELKSILQKATAKYLTEPNVTVIVRTINSRKVFITGEVTKPGAYQLSGPQTVMQLIAMAGGLTEYADANAITVMRTENGRQRSFPFRYKDVAKGKALAQNIQLLPGDTVVVP
jgi:polysaccharide export outer membrane protein